MLIKVNWWDPLARYYPKKVCVWRGENLVSSVKSPIDIKEEKKRWLSSLLHGYNQRQPMNS